MRIVWSGLHIPGKALPLFLSAIARARSNASIKVEILGAGPETQECQAMASRLRLDRLVTWHGKIRKREALSVMAGAHVLLHSSLKEGTPSVVLEALSLGLPVICHDISGMALAVTEECGIKVPLRDPESSIGGFARAIERLANDAALYERLSAGAIARAEELSWDGKIQQFSEAYCDAVDCPPATGTGSCESIPNLMR
jgi:glycosyltransferase involved in cell wall biosynthesis